MIITAQHDHTRHRIAAIGTFDGVHLGHRHLVDTVCARGRELGLTPSVVTFSNHPRRLVDPGFRIDMLMDIDERIKALSDSGIKDVIVLKFDASVRAMSSREFIRRLHADFDIDALVMGFNHRFGSDRLTDFEQYRTIGAEEGVTVIPADEYVPDCTQSVSSSAIRRMLRERCPEQAAKMMGRPYSITGVVEHGKELGRTIGFPTANVAPANPDQLIPGNGVYAADVVLPDKSRRRAILNIGHRPTVDTADAPVSIEAHILDFDGDLYGKLITIEFLRFLRSERRFSSLDGLRRQLEADSAEAHKI